MLLTLDPVKFEAAFAAAAAEPSFPVNEVEPGVTYLMTFVVTPLLAGEKLFCSDVDMNAFSEDDFQDLEDILGDFHEETDLESISIAILLRNIRSCKARTVQFELIEGANTNER